MRLALFGRKIDNGNIGKIALLIDKLAEVGKAGIYYYRPFYDNLKQYLPAIPAGGLFNSFLDLPKGLDLFLSLGGDGSFLEAVTIVRNSGVPIAGINFGRLGFLTSASMEENNPWIEKLFSGDYFITESPLLRFSEMPEVSGSVYKYALNEVTVQRTSPCVLEVDVVVNGEMLPTYYADGILIATPTGSTAYSLSVGGPVVTPEANVLVISPISPHNLNVRPLVVPLDSKIELSFSSRSGSALLTADNRSLIVRNGTKILVSEAEYRQKRVSLNDNFIAALNDKLLWGEDKRNVTKK
ncbi:MAG: NAD(+)/NADH kinase [Bacteroidales bacterium]|jgi:NAD+ kinase|nr:NAD(+)/NADH kinase [Bacteroidales bacterium]